MGWSLGKGSDGLDDMLSSHYVRPDKAIEAHMYPLNELFTVTSRRATREWFTICQDLQLQRQSFHGL